MKSATVTQNKVRKIEERKIAICDRMKAAEDYYRAERQKRMEELFGAPNSQQPVVS